LGYFWDIFGIFFGYFWDIFFFIKLGDTLFWDIFVTFLGKEQLNFLYGGGGETRKKKLFLTSVDQNFSFYFSFCHKINIPFLYIFLDKNHIS